MDGERVDGGLARGERADGECDLRALGSAVVWSYDSSTSRGC